MEVYLPSITNTIIEKKTIKINENFLQDFAKENNINLDYKFNYTNVIKNIKNGKSEDEKENIKTEVSKFIID